MSTLSYNRAGGSPVSPDGMAASIKEVHKVANALKIKIEEFYFRGHCITFCFSERDESTIRSYFVKNPPKSAFALESSYQDRKRRDGLAEKINEDLCDEEAIYLKHFGLNADRSCDPDGRPIVLITDTDPEFYKKLSRENNFKKLFFGPYLALKEGKVTTVVYV